MNKRQIVKFAVTAALGFILWLILGPHIISMGHETETFVSVYSWVGLFITMCGVMTTIYSFTFLMR
jgi:hypothetical protein